MSGHSAARGRRTTGVNPVADSLRQFTPETSCYFPPRTPDRASCLGCDSCDAHGFDYRIPDIQPSLPGVIPSSHRSFSRNATAKNSSLRMRCDRSQNPLVSRKPTSVRRCLARQGAEPYVHLSANPRPEHHPGQAWQEELTHSQSASRDGVGVSPPPICPTDFG